MQIGERPGELAEALCRSRTGSRSPNSQHSKVPLEPEELEPNPMYFVASGRPLTGAPPLLMTRRHIKGDAAEKHLAKTPEGGVAGGWSAVGQQQQDPPGILAVRHVTKPNAR